MVEVLGWLGVAVWVAVFGVFVAQVVGGLRTWWRGDLAGVDLDAPEKSAEYALWLNEVGIA